jgi:hypothetical protein
MTRGELGIKLDTLRPGEELKIKEFQLAAIFSPGDTLNHTTVEEARMFAEIHGCILYYDGISHEDPRFQCVTDEAGDRISSS